MPRRELRRHLREEVVRIGWPDTGNMMKPSKSGALAREYSYESLPAHVQRYLVEFRSIGIGSVILMPNPDVRAELYIGTSTSPYDYFHDLPHHPYECAHRIGVRWDTLSAMSWSKVLSMG